MHIVAHDYTSISAFRTSIAIGIPCVLSVHDDIAYALLGHPLKDRAILELGELWRNSSARMVISPEIGEEYCTRYGVMEYEVITDGLETFAAAPVPHHSGTLRLYFMGLFHLRYRPNMRAVLDALKLLRERHPDWRISVVCRCGQLPIPLWNDDVMVEVLPFAPEAQVALDLLETDILYQPLPFEKEAEALNRFSLSTKMVTYLGSGLPILYHGPPTSAAGALLARNEAAGICSSLNPPEIASAIEHLHENREQIVQSALGLARRQFSLHDQQERFWSAFVLDAG